LLLYHHTGWIETFIRPSVGADCDVLGDRSQGHTFTFALRAGCRRQGSTGLRPGRTSRSKRPNVEHRCGTLSLVRVRVLLQPKLGELSVGGDRSSRFLTPLPPSDGLATAKRACGRPCLFFRFFRYPPG